MGLEDSSGAGHRTRLISTTGRPVQLSGTAYTIYTRLAAGEPSDVVAQALSVESGRPINEREVAAANKHVQHCLDKIDSRRAIEPFGMWIRFTVLSARHVNAAAVRLAHAFRPVVAFCLLTGVATSALLVALGDGPRFFSRGFRPTDVLAGYALLLVSLAAHELGHASACRRYGALPSTVGVGIYWFYPVLYADVSAAWRLPRHQRIVVDLGGAFFQLVTAGIWAALYAVGGWGGARVGCLMALASLAFSANPFLRSDAYWLLADVLDVPHLQDNSRRTLRHPFSRPRGSLAGQAGWKTAVVVLYSIANPLFWAAVLGAFTVQVLPYLYEYPRVLASLVEALLARPASISTSQLGHFLTSTAIVAVVFALSYRLFARMVIKRHAAQLK
jgi:putative peptide zinc metalloprotease protein